MLDQKKHHQGKKKEEAPWIISEPKGWFVGLEVLDNSETTI
jgi:hypothetical protein